MQIYETNTIYSKCCLNNDATFIFFFSARQLAEIWEKKILRK